MKRSLLLVILALVPAAATPEDLVAKKAFLVQQGKRHAGELRITKELLEFTPAVENWCRPNCPESDGPRGVVRLRKGQIKTVETAFRKEGASVGSIFMFGLHARKKNFTTIGITTHIGKIFVFSIKGKESMEYVMAIRLLASEEPG